MGSIARFLGWIICITSIIAGFALMPNGKNNPCFLPQGCNDDVKAIQAAYVLTGFLSGLAWLVILDAVGKLHEALDRSNSSAAPRMEPPSPSQGNRGPINPGDRVRLSNGGCATVDSIDELGAATIRMDEGGGIRLVMAYMLHPINASSAPDSQEEHTL